MTNNKQKFEKNRPYSKLDYSIKDPQERSKIVHEIIDKTPSNKLNSYYLQELAFDKYALKQITTETSKYYYKNERVINYKGLEISLSEKTETFDDLLKKGLNRMIEKKFLIIIDKFYFKIDKEEYFG